MVVRYFTRPSVCVARKLIAMGTWTTNTFMLRLTERISTHDERIGQAAFNVLNELDPDLADMIRGSLVDPFYKDSRLPEFYATVFGKDLDNQG